MWMLLNPGGFQVLQVDEAASGQTKHGTGAEKTRATQKAGHKLYVGLAFSVVKDREGNGIGAMGTARPFTEDKTQ